MLGKNLPPAWYYIHSLWVAMSKELAMTFPHVALLSFLALFLSNVEESGLLLPVTNVCGRTQLPPRGRARPEAKEEVLQHPLGKIGLAVSAWLYSSSWYHLEIQEKGCNSNQILPGIPIPNGGQWMFLPVPELWGVSPWGIFTYNYGLYQEM